MEAAVALARSRSLSAASSSSADDSSSASSPSRRASNSFSHPRRAERGVAAGDCGGGCRARYTPDRLRRTTRSCARWRRRGPGPRTGRRRPGRVLGSARRPAGVSRPPPRRELAGCARRRGSSPGTRRRQLTRIPSSTTPTTSAPTSAARRRSAPRPCPSPEVVRGPFQHLHVAVVAAKALNLFTHRRRAATSGRSARRGVEYVFLCVTVARQRVLGRVDERPPGAASRRVEQAPSSLDRRRSRHGRRLRVRDHSSPLCRDHERAIIAT